MESQSGSSSQQSEDINLPSKKRQKRTYFTINEKQMVVNMYKYVKETWPAGEYPYKTNISEKTASVLGVGVASVYRIMKEYTTNDEVKSPQTTKKKPSFADKIEEFDQKVIRKKVHNYFFQGGLPTFDKVLQDVNDDDDLPSFKRSTFQKILKHLKFKYVKRQRINILIDRDDIILWRINYLRNIKKYRMENRRIFYMDETWVNAGKTVLKSYVDITESFKWQTFMKGLSTDAKYPITKGKRLIVIHIGNENGFVQGADEMFESKSTDYHESMDPIHFERWLENILPKLGQNAVLVLDNARHHSRRQEKCPTTAWKKSSIQEWLRSKGISYEENNVKAELMVKVNKVKAKYQSYAVDEIAKKYKVEILRLPPYHCELNPIDLVWADVKGYVARNNTTFKIEDVKKLVQEGIENVSADKWKNCVEHIIEVENNFYTKLDIKMDTTLDSFDVNTTNDNYFSSETSSCDEDNE